MSKYIIETAVGATRRTLGDVSTIAGAQTLCAIAMSKSREEGGPDFAFATDEQGRWRVSMERMQDGRIVNHLAGRATNTVTDSVTVTITLPVNAPLAAYVNAIEMAHARHVAQGSTAGAEALAVLAILCSRGHQELLADRAGKRNDMTVYALRDRTEDGCIDHLAR